MRIKLDENLPAGLVPLLAALGHEVDTVTIEGIGGEDDDVAAARHLTGDGDRIVAG